MIFNLDPYPAISTARLHLRGLADTDSAQIMALRSNDSVNTYLDRHRPITLTDAVAFIKKIKDFTDNENGLYWAITLPADDQLIGTICLYNFDKENNIAEIGYELMPFFQGKGLMQEAMAAIIDYAFGVIKIKVITASPHSDNLSSIKLLEKNSFSIDTSFTQLGRYLIYTLENSN